MVSSSVIEGWQEGDRLILNLRLSPGANRVIKLIKQSSV
jgi:hypothetical protein